ncbi:hypothetical protein V6N11_059128 [Hibiscus sabdariffa]|uniref:Uncharacterized protein n=2 Tax=Hibiscus sabdariffa TaxID=183260 RepID=A0ABR1ZHE3_9ROSI
MHLTIRESSPEAGYRGERVGNYKPEIDYQRHPLCLGSMRDDRRQGWKKTGILINEQLPAPLQNPYFADEVTLHTAGLQIVSDDHRSSLREDKPLSSKDSDNKSG